MKQNEIKVLWIPAELNSEVQKELPDGVTLTYPDGTRGSVRFQSKNFVTFQPENPELPTLEHTPVKLVSLRSMGRYTVYEKKELPFD